MNIAVLNAGSGSQKLARYELGNGIPAEPMRPAWSAHVNTTAPDQPEGKLWVEITAAGEHRRVTISKDLLFPEKVEHLLALLQAGAPPGFSLGAIAHRIVHGGSKYAAAVPVTAEVEQDIEAMAAFAPLHNPDNLAGIRIARRFLGEAVRSYAVFDTAFHQTLPEAAYAYPGPYHWLGQGIRRYGFHGSSFRWASQRAAALLRREGDAGLKLIICHLGGGCSLAATVGGRSIDTTMGLTPLDGVAMCTRPGSLDPGILIHLLKGGMAVDELETLLNKNCGLKGLSGLPGDTRVICAHAEAGDERARLALDVFVHRLNAGVGQMIAALGDRPDAIIFTDVIGESEPTLRTRVCGAFAHLGVTIDPSKNAAATPDSDVATAGSAVRVLIIHCEEEWQIATECFHCATAL